MQKNFTIRPMNAENIRECADLFMRTFSKEPWNDVYESEEEVIRFFQRYLNNNCFTGYILTCKDSVIALCLGSRKPWLNGMEYEINQFCVAEAFQRQGVGSYGYLYLFKSQFQKDWLFPVNNSFSHVPSPS